VSKKISKESDVTGLSKKELKEIKSNMKKIMIKKYNNTNDKNNKF